MPNGEPGWFASLLGAAVLIAGGFALGLVAGVVSEEPELVVGHLVGRSDEVAWQPSGEPEFTEDGEALALEELERTDTPDMQPAEREGRSAGDAFAAAASSQGSGPELPPLDDAADARGLPPVAAAPPSRRATRDIDSLPDASPRREPAGSASGAGPRSGFAVQVGAFADGGAANAVRRKLAAKGFDTYVIPASGDGKWRVRVGPVPSRGAAEALAGRLKSEERLPTWVLAEGGLSDHRGGCLR